MESISFALGPTLYADSTSVSSPSQPGASSPPETARARVASISPPLASVPNAGGIEATARGSSSRLATL